MPAGRLLAATAIVVLVGVGLFLSGVGGEILFKLFTAYNQPGGDFDPMDAVPAPDYSEAANWAALPSKPGPAALVPAGVAVEPQGEHPVDVFFIHPTGFLTSGSWTSPMDPDSGTEENTAWMMANQASAFNGCCNVYAPRYREANIFAYFEPPEDRDAVLSFAYQDVRRAFEYYVQQENRGRPFIIAAHSQGTHHAQRLLAEVIDTTDLHERMVAAYLIGSIIIPLTQQWVDSLSHIDSCQASDQLHCVVHWDTMPEGSDGWQREEVGLCTNPLSWEVNEAAAQASLNKGAVMPVGIMNGAMGKQEDIASGQRFEAMGAPHPQQTGAQCRNGTLYARPSDPEKFAGDRMGTYHELDYALFYMNIHNNASLRANRYLSQ